VAESDGSGPGPANECLPGMLPADDWALLLGRSSDMAEVVDCAGRLRFINAAGQAALGLTAAPAGLAAYTAPQSLELLHAVAFPAARQGRWEGTIELVAQDGTPLMLGRTVFALRDERGEVCGFVMQSHPLEPACGDDPTDADRDAHARELAFTLEFAITTARAFVFEWDIASDRVHRRLGAPGALPPTAPEGDPLSAFLERVHPDDLPAMQAIIERSLAMPGERYEASYRVIRDDGTIAWLYEAGQAEAGEDGEPHRMIGITRDISDFMETQARLGRSEEQLRHNIRELEELYARAPLGLGLLDTELRFARINQALADINGLSVEEHLGKRVWDLLPGVRESAEPPLRAVLESGEPMLDVPVVGTTPARPDDVREWREQFYPIRGDGGKVIGIGVVCEEVTERLRLERELRAFSESLEQRVAEEVEKREAAMAVLAQSQKLDALGQLTAGIAHDFNNVVAAISGGFSLVERWSEQEKVREIARHGAEAARRGGDLVKHLLAFARQQVLAPKTVELDGLIENLRPLIAQSLGRGIGLTIATAPEPCWVHVDPLLLETALINLAVNARDAMPGGGEIRIAVQRADPATSPLGEREACAVVVQDSGEGMAPDVLARALEPFFTTKDMDKGTGLGLAMVHGFARQSGGALELDSAPGRGTRVTLTLPRAAEALAAGPETTTATAANGSGQTILLIDDDELVRTVTSHQLQELGYRVREAAGGDAAVALLAAGMRIDLVLCDVVMPREDGPTVAARIRARWPGLPIVFMTGHAERERLAGEAILDKPFTAGHLAAHVERHLLRDGASQSS